MGRAVARRHGGRRRGRDDFRKNTTQGHRRVPGEDGRLGLLQVAEKQGPWSVVWEVVRERPFAYSSAPQDAGDVVQDQGSIFA